MQRPRAATLGHCGNTCWDAAEHLLMIVTLQCFHPPVRAHISIINKSVYLAWHLHHKETDLAPVLSQAQEKKNNRLKRGLWKVISKSAEQLVSSFQQHKTPKGHVWPLVIFAPYCIFTSGTILVPHLAYTTCPLLPAAASSVAQSCPCISTDLLEGARGVMQGCWD